MSSFAYLTIAPISKDKKSECYIDYENQKERVSNGEKWCWDDWKENNSQVGNYFAFFFYGKKIVIHKILSVKPPSERLPTWSKRERNMLVLSDKLLEISWTTWQQLDGPESRMGTYIPRNLQDSRPLLYSYLKSLLEPKPKPQILLVEEEEEEENALIEEKENALVETVEEIVVEEKQQELLAKLEKVQKLIKELQNIEANYIKKLNK